MWRQLIRIGLLTLVPMFVSAGSAYGQSLGYRIQATIPFDFIVGEKKLPAGEYFIGRARISSDDSLLTINARNSSAGVFSSTYSVQTLEQSEYGKLVFHRYGDQWFLFQIWPAGGNTGREIRSKLEREAERKTHVVKGPMETRSVLVHLD